MSLVQNLRVDYGSFRLEIPKWEIADQGVTTLWGPSGAGKTSVLRVLLGLDLCPELKWQFRGEDLAALPLGERRLGVVFQNHEVFPHMSIAGNVAFAAKARGIAEAHWHGDLKNWAEALGLSGILARKAHLLSGGERQRTALLRALAARPQFLFLDEPFSNLDEELRVRTRELIRQVTRERNIPVLLITHDQADVENFSDHLVKIKDGKLV